MCVVLSKTDSFLVKPGLLSRIFTSSWLKRSKGIINPSLLLFESKGNPGTTFLELKSSAKISLALPNVILNLLQNRSWLTDFSKNPSFNTVGTDKMHLFYEAVFSIGFLFSKVIPINSVIIPSSNLRCIYPSVEL